MARTITMTLNLSSIDMALDELEQYRNSFDQRVDELKRRMAEQIRDDSAQGFARAQVEDIAHASRDGQIVDYEPVNDVTVSLAGDGTTIQASGNEVNFIEFGAGITHNAAAGQTNHPWGGDFGFLIGSYGQGKGARRMWAFKLPDGTKVVTRGTPGVMPMYRAMTRTTDNLQELVEEVFR